MRLARVAVRVRAPPPLVAASFPRGTGSPDGDGAARGSRSKPLTQSHLDSVVRRSRDELNGPAPPARPAGPPAAARDRVPRRPYDARDALPFARAVGSRETERFALYAARFPARVHGVRRIWGIRYAAPIRDLQVRHPLPPYKRAPRAAADRRTVPRNGSRTAGRAPRPHASSGPHDHHCRARAGARDVRERGRLACRA